MLSWDMTGASRQKMLLNKHLYRNLCTTLDGDNIIAARQMPSCCIARYNYDRWNIVCGGERIRGDHKEILQAIRETPYIILYDSLDAEFFKTKEDVEQHLSDQLGALKDRIKYLQKEAKKLICRKKEIIEILDKIKMEEK